MGTVVITDGQVINPDLRGDQSLVESLERRWYAVQVRPRHEKKVATELERRGIENYLPLSKQVHRWSDRKKVVEVPLFAGYSFVRGMLDAQFRLAALSIYGILKFVGPQGTAAPIPDSQIDDVRRLAGHSDVTPYPFLEVGQRVVIHGGAFDGVEGVLTECQRRLVVSVSAIQQSISIGIEGYDVRPVTSK